MVGYLLHAILVTSMSDRGDGLGEIEAWMAQDALGSYAEAVAEGKRRKAAGKPIEWFEPREDVKISRYKDALDRIARFAEAYEEVSNAKPDLKENVGSALCVTLGRYARKVLAEI
jgi:hypothetical protein